MEHTLPDEMVFIRHGESVGNVKSRAHKATKDPSIYDEEFRKIASCRWELTDRGHEQARLTGLWVMENLGEDVFDRYYTSPFDRAAKTAVALSLPNASWRLDDRLAERSHGDTEGLSPEDVAELNPANMLNLRISPYYHSMPNGESRAALAHGRVGSLLGTFARECSGMSVLSVTHGDYIGSVQMKMEKITGIEWETIRREEYRQIWNCQIVQYTNTNPYTGEKSAYPTHWRSVRAWEDAGDGRHVVAANIGADEWYERKPKKYSNQELAQLLADRDRLAVPE